MGKSRATNTPAKSESPSKETPTPTSKAKAVDTQDHPDTGERVANLEKAVAELGQAYLELTHRFNHHQHESRTQAIEIHEPKAPEPEPEPTSETGA